MARENRLGSSQFTAIGAFRTATIGYFDRERQNYIKLPIGEQVEVLKGFVARSCGTAA